MTGTKTKSVYKLLVSHNLTATQTIEDQRGLIFEFMKALCLCHEVVTEIKNAAIKYQGPSPDEIALVEAAADLGFILLQASEDNIEVNFTKGNMGCDSYDSESIDQIRAIEAADIDLELEFEHNRKGEHYGPGLHMFQVKRRMQFTSDRKRMSILVHDPTTDNLKLFIKGADSTIEERLDPDQNDDEVIRCCREFALSSSKIGLRTLYIGMKLLDKTEVADFFKQVEQAESIMNAQ